MFQLEIKIAHQALNSQNKYLDNQFNERLQIKDKRRIQSIS